MSIVHKVYDNLSELIDFLPEDLLNEISVLVNSSLNFIQHSNAPDMRWQFDLWDSPIKNKIETFLKQEKFINKNDYIISLILWKDVDVKNQSMFIPLHIDPYREVYKAIQIYLTDDDCPSSVWFDSDVYNTCYDRLTTMIVTETDIPGVYQDNKNPIEGGIKGKLIKYGKNRGYMYQNSLENPLPHAVTPNFKTGKERISLYIVVANNDYVIWRCKNEHTDLGIHQNKR